MATGLFKNALPVYAFTRSKGALWGVCEITRFNKILCEQVIHSTDIRFIQKSSVVFV